MSKNVSVGTDMAPVWNADMERVMALAPSIKTYPAVAAALAVHAPTLTDSNIIAVGQATSAIQQKTFLESVDSKSALTAYNGLNDQVKAQLKELQYTPPETPGQPSWYNPLGWVQSASNTVKGWQESDNSLVSGAANSMLDINGAVSTGIGAGLNALSYVPNQMSHLNRVASAASNMLGYGNAAQAIGGEYFGTGGSIGQHNYYNIDVEHSSAFGIIGQLWNATSDGEKTFNEVELAKAAVGQDPATFAIMRSIAAAGPDSRAEAISNEVLKVYDAQPDAKSGAAAAADLVKFIQSAEGGKLMGTIESTKSSFGREVGYALGIDPNTAWFTSVSGGLDATLALLTDPTIVGGKFMTAYKVMRWGVNISKAGGGATAVAMRLDTMALDKGVKAYVEGSQFSKGLLHYVNVARNPSSSVVEAANARKVLDKKFTQSKNLQDWLIGRPMNEQFHTTQDMFDALKVNNAVGEVLRGHAAYNVPLMPHTTWVNGAIGSVFRNESRMTARKSTTLSDVALGRARAAYEPLATGLTRLYQKADGSWTSHGASSGSADKYLDVTAEQLKGIPKAEKRGKGANFGYQVDATLAEDAVSRAASVDLSAFSALGISMAGLRAGKALPGQSKVRGKIDGWANRSQLTLSRLTTLLPDEKNGMLQLTGEGSSGAGRTMYLLARGIGPKNFAYQIRAAFDAADDAGKRTIYKGLMNTMGEASGITRTGDGAKYWAHFIDDEASRKYGLDGAAKLKNGSEVGLYAGDMRTYVSMPRFHEMYKFSDKVGVLSKVGGALSNNSLDFFTQKIFKPGVLLRPALAVRNGGEELVRHILANGLRSYPMGRMLARELKGDDAYGAVYRVLCRPVASVYVRASLGRGGKTGLGLSADSTALSTWDELLKAATEKHGGPLSNTVTNRLRETHKRDISTAIHAGQTVDLAVVHDYPDLVNLRAGNKGIFAGHTSRKLRIDYTVSKMNSPRNFFIAHVSSKLRVAGLHALMGKEGYDNLREFWDLNPTLRETFGNELRDLSVAGYRDSGADLNRLVMKDGRVQYVKMSASGKWGDVPTDGLTGATKWALRVERIANDGIGKYALLHLDDKAAAISVMKKVAEAEPDLLKGSALSAEIGLDAHLGIIWDDVAKHFIGENGYRNKNLWRHIVHGESDNRSITFEHINGPDFHEIVPDWEVHGQRPAFVVGQENLMEIGDTPNMVQRFIDNGFGVLADTTSWLSKEPIFFFNLSKAFQVNKAYMHDAIMRVHGASEAQIDAWRLANPTPGVVREAPQAMQAAQAHAGNWVKAQYAKQTFDQALTETMKYVDNAEVRSQFAVIVRAWIPFWRAQEEFYRRWAKTAYYHPESIRKLQLTMGGLQDSGLIQTDDQGDQYFMYPGSTVTTQALTSVLSKLHIGVSLPTPYPLRGYVRFLNQGIDPKNIQPSFSPIIGIPLQLAAKLFPELTPTAAAVLGDQGMVGSWYTQLFPTPIRRLWDAGALGDGMTQQLMSAMTSQAAYMESIPKMKLADNPTAAELQIYTSRLVQGSRNILVVRAALGLFTPAPPTAGDMSPDLPQQMWAPGWHSLTDEFRALVAKMGPEKAYGVWLAANPDQMPFTVSKTGTNVGETLTPTQEAETFLAANSGFAASNPEAVSFWLPQGGKFDSAVYRNEMAMGLAGAHYKDIETFIKDIKLSSILSTYFDYRDSKDKEIAAAQDSGDTTKVAAIKAGWASWQADTFGVNGYLKDYLAAGATRVAERESRMTAIENALPNAPAGATTDAIRQVVDGYTEYKSERAVLLADKTDAGVEARNALDARFQSWVQLCAANDKNVDMIYQRLFRWM